MTDDSPHRTLVLGLGNPIRGDDGVGWRVVEVLQINLAKVKTANRSQVSGKEDDPHPAFPPGEKGDPEPEVSPGKREKGDPQPDVPPGRRQRDDPQTEVPPGERKKEDPHPTLPGWAKRRGRENIEVDMLAGGGLNLMERLVGYDRAILVDAMQSGQEPGSVQVFPLEALDNPSAGHLGSTHETNLLTALEIGRSLGAHLPPVGGVMIVSIEAQPVFEFSEELSLPVAQAVPEAVKKVMNLLKVC
jgi:hydrogenase maturation protease